MFKLQSQTPLPAVDGAQYCALAYDGCFFYLTVRGARIIVQLDGCFQTKAHFSTRRAYTALCYDRTEACFWAAASCPSVLYKLNLCMEEIDCIRLHTADCGPVTGLSYTCCDRSLLVTTTGALFRVPTACPEKQACIQKPACGWFMGVLSLCPYLLCCCAEGTKSCVCVYTQGGELLRKIPIRGDEMPVAAVFCPCGKDCCNRLIVLYNKHGCYPHLVQYAVCCGSLCPCNYEICRPCPPACSACTDVLESIALMEAALSHILNAEGEKLQKVIASTDDVCKITAVNESVNKTMNKAIFLEQLLCCKLESLGGCGCEKN